MSAPNPTYTALLAEVRRLREEARAFALGIETGADDE